MKKVNVMVDAHMSCEPRIDIWRGSYGPNHYKHKTFASAKQAALQSWLKDFTEFLRDHRSQDEVDLSVEADYEGQCSKCEKPFELDDENCCAHCGDALEVEVKPQ